MMGGLLVCVLSGCDERQQGDKNDMMSQDDSQVQNELTGCQENCRTHWNELVNCQKIRTNFGFRT